MAESRCLLCGGALRREVLLAENRVYALSLRIVAEICQSCHALFWLPGQTAALEVLRGAREFPGFERKEVQP